MSKNNLEEKKLFIHGWKPQIEYILKMWSSFPKAKVFQLWYLGDLFASQLKAEFLIPIPKRGHIS